MKRICYHCKHAGKQWKVAHTIPNCHCEHPEAQKKAKSAWDTVMEIFDTCDKWEGKV